MIKATSSLLVKATVKEGMLTLLSRRASSIEYSGRLDGG